MNPIIGVVGASDSQLEVRSLLDWLRREEDLRGSLMTLMDADVAPGHMGAISDLIQVAVGPGATLTVLAGAIVAWVQSRTSDLHVTVNGVDIDVKRVRHPELIVEQALAKRVE
jgi:Effector Associated Constant Component 1